MGCANNIAHFSAQTALYATVWKQHTGEYGRDFSARCGQNTQIEVVTKTEWIASALDALKNRGASSVKVEALARALGVTKGSFYWHFSDRQDLLAQTLEHWADLQAQYLDGRKAMEFETPHDRLRDLLDFISSKDASQDILIRHWAHQEPWVREKVEQIDRIRLSFFEDIFLKIGFEEEEA